MTTPRRIIIRPATEEFIHWFNSPPGTQLVLHDTALTFTTDGYHIYVSDIDEPEKDLFIDHNYNRLFKYMSQNFMKDLYEPLKQVRPDVIFSDRNHTGEITLDGLKDLLRVWRTVNFQ